MARIFLSYPSELRDDADTLNLSLTGRGHTVFFDKDSLPKGDTYEQQIERAVKRSTLIIFLVSPNAFEQGRYTLTELQIARRQWPSPGGRVLPVVVRPTQMADIPTYLKAVTVLEPSGSVSAEVASTVDEMLAAISRKARPLRLTGLAIGLAALALGLLFHSDIKKALVGPNATKVTLSCVGSDTHRAIVAGSLNYEQAEKLGELCAKEILPEGSHGAPNQDSRKKFVERFAVSATSKDENERRAAAMVTQGNSEAAIESFLSLADNAVGVKAKLRHLRSAASLSIRYHPKRAIGVLEKITKLDPDDLFSLNALVGLYSTSGQATEAERVSLALKESARSSGLDWQGTAALQEANRLASVNDYKNAELKFKEAKRYFDQTGNKWGSTSCLVQLGNAIFSQGGIAEATSLADEAIASAESYTIVSVLADAKILKARILAAKMDLDGAEKLFKETQEIYEGLSNKYGAAFAAQQRAGILAQQQDWDGALELLRSSKEVYRALDSSVDEAWAEINSGQVYQAKGELDRARSAYGAAREMFLESSNPAGEGVAIYNLAGVEGQSGRIDLAISLLGTAEVVADRAGLTDLKAQVLSMRAYSHRIQGQPERALSDFEESIRLYKESKNIIGLVSALEQTASILKARRRIDEAREALEEALALSESLQMDSFVIRIRYELDRL